MSWNTLPHEIQSEIISKINSSQLPSLQIINQGFRRLCLLHSQSIQNKHNLKEACMQDHRLSLIRSRNYVLTDLFKAYQYACYGNQRQLITILFNHLNKIYNQSDEKISWTDHIDTLNAYGLKGAIKGNHIELVHQFCQNGADVTDAIYFAYRYHYQELMDYLQENLEDDLELSAAAFDGACTGGHLDLAKKMVQTSMLDDLDDYDYLEAYHGSFRKNHKEVIEWLLNDFGFANFEQWSQAFEGAVEGGHLDLVKQIYQACPQNKCALVFNAICVVIVNNRIDIMKWLLPRCNEDSYNYAIECIELNGTPEMAAVLI